MCLVLGGRGGQAIEGGGDGGLLVPAGGGGGVYPPGGGVGGVQSADRQIGACSGDCEPPDEGDSASGRDESLLAHPPAAVRPIWAAKPTRARFHEYACGGRMVFRPRDLGRGAGLVLRPGPGDGHRVDHGPGSPIGPLHWGPSGFRPVAWAWTSLWPAPGPARWPPLTVLRCPVGTSNREFSAG